MRGRKPIHLEMVGKKTNRQRIWEAIRKEPDGFTGYALARHAQVHDDAVRSYLQSLLRSGHVEVIAGAELFCEQTLRLIKDVGVEAPAITRQGEVSRQGQGGEAMWRTLRILGEVDARQLTDNASVAAPITLWTAKTFIKWLYRAGYLQLVEAGHRGRLARYRLKPGMYTGPRPPMIQKGGAVFDPNLGEVVYRHAAETEGEPA